jgi:coiled-coil and C2 domain-containing protein 2A
MWVNIADSRVPPLDFNFKTNPNWKVVIQRSNGISSIQKEINYKPVNEEFIKNIQQEILHTLTSKIEKWRGRFITKWNRACSRALETTCVSLENMGTRASENSNNELQKLQNHYKMRGFPLNFTFTEIDTIINTIENTHVYASSDENVEFGMAVYCKGYPSVTSVWVFIASLTKISNFLDK